MINAEKMEDLKLRLQLAKSALADAERDHADAFGREEKAHDLIAKIYLEIDNFVDSYLEEE